MALAPDNQHGKRLRKRYRKVRNHLFTFLEHPDVPPDNNGSEVDPIGWTGIGLT
jgi:transposase